MTESKSRNWSTKTLARQLFLFLHDTEHLSGESTISDLIDAVKSSIVAEEVGADFDSLYG